MTPDVLNAQQWEMLFSALTSIAFFVGFVILGALSFLLGYAVIPSVTYPPFSFIRLRVQQAGLCVIGLVSFAAATYQMARAISLTLPVLSEFYPRWWI